MRKLGIIIGTIIISTAFMIVACVPKLTAPPPTRTYSVAPESLQLAITTALPGSPLNLNVVSAHEGVIETQYEEYEGDYHGFLWWRRRWPERRKYNITIRHKWNSPFISELFISADIEERPNEQYPWTYKETTVEHEGIFRILAVIDEKVGG